MCTTKTTVRFPVVQSVYSGAAGKCCCGCKGTHSVAPAHRAAAEASRGYAYDDSQVSDAAVNRVVGKILSAPAESLEFGDGYVAAVIGSRQYVAYLA